MSLREWIENLASTNQVRYTDEDFRLFTEFKGELYRARIHHEPWQLYKAELTRFDSTMLEALQITQPKTQPILHHAEEVNVDIWMLESVED